MAGRAEDAWRHYKKITPAFTKDQELRKIEPYVFCQMVAGKDAARPGEGKNSWLTGTAAWTWKAVSEALLGIKPQFDGLLVEPCIPIGTSVSESIGKFALEAWSIRFIGKVIGSLPDGLFAPVRMSVTELPPS